MANKSVHNAGKSSLFPFYFNFFFELKELENQRKSYLSKIALLTHFTQM